MSKDRRMKELESDNNNMEMETYVISERAILTLRGGNGYTPERDDKSLYASDLKKLAVGDKITTSYGNTFRDSIEESFEVVYKNERGLAALIRTIRGTDEPTPEKSEDVCLTWFELH